MASHRIPFLRSTLSSVLMLMPFVAHAQANFNANIQQTIGVVIQTTIETLNLLTWVMFIFLNQLLDPLVIFNNGAMSPMLNQIWQLSRNIMNVTFAVILIFAAVFTVITAKKDFVASNLKKFVMAVVLVNFSWFIPMVILDAANVAAATVFSLPSVLGQNNVCEFRTTAPPAAVQCQQNPPDPNNPGAPRTFTCPCVMAVNAKFFVTPQQANQLPANQGWVPYLGKTMYVQLQALNGANVAPHSYILNGLILNHARLAGVASVPPFANGPGVGGLIMYFIQAGVLLVIHIALFFPLAAMTLAFAIRIPVLWFTIAFMPFWILTLLPLGSIVGDYPKQLGDYFLKAAFLPAICGIPLTIGFIMINAGQQAATFQGLQQIGFRLTNNISDFFELLWLFMCLGVFYMGTFSVLKKYGGIMAAGAGAIENAGKSLGSLAVKVPLHTVPVPIPGGGSLLNMMQRFNPAALNSAFNAGVANNQSLQSILNPSNMQNQNTLQTTATTNSANATHMTALDTDIKALTAAIRAGTANASHYQTLSTHLGGATVNATNYKTQLQDYARKLNLSGASTKAAAAQFATLQATINTL